MLLVKSTSFSASSPASEHAAIAAATLASLIASPPAAFCTCVGATRQSLPRRLPSFLPPSSFGMQEEGTNFPRLCVSPLSPLLPPVGNGCMKSRWAGIESAPRPSYRVLGAAGRFNKHNKSAKGKKHTRSPSIRPLYFFCIYFALPGQPPSRASGTRGGLTFPLKTGP